jgi:hypothetical protein
VNDTVPVAEAVHVGLLEVVEENEPDAPLDDHEYEYPPEPCEIDSPNDTDCPTSMDVVDTDAETEGANMSSVPEAVEPSIFTVHVLSVPPVEP